MSQLKMKAQGRRWWVEAAAAAALGSLECVCAFVVPAGAGVAIRSSGGSHAECVTLSRHTRLGAGPTAYQSRTSLGATGMGMLGAESNGKKDWVGPTSERDQAMGFLSAEAVPGTERDSAETRQVKAKLLAQEAKVALEAAYAAEAHAKSVKAKLGGDKVVPSPKVNSNGLSHMLSPVAMRMTESQGEYLRRCPIRQMQEDLLEIRCGVMNIVGALGPQNLLALGAVLYAISVIQLSM